MAIYLQPDTEIIQLTTHHFLVGGVPVNEAVPLSPDTTYRVVGPDTVEVFRWNGSTYQLESRTQSAPGLTISSEIDLLTSETRRLVHDIVVQPFQEISGSLEIDGWRSVSLVDPEGYDAAWANFWGLSSPGEKDIDWGRIPNIPAIAAHNSSSEGLGEWIAGVIGAKGHALCRLTVQRYTANSFSLLGQVDIPCIVTFTHLAWVDLTGDGDDELLLRTIPPYVDTYKTGASFQRLYIYTTGNELTELAVLDGELNGPDGKGICWGDVNGDGIVEILAGLPLLDIEDRKLPDTLARRFQVFHWDAARQEFVVSGVWIPDGAD